MYISCNTVPDKEAMMRALLLLPKVCGGKWRIDNTTTRETCSRIIDVFPVIGPILEEDLIKGFTRPKEYSAPTPAKNNGDYSDAPSVPTPPPDLLARAKAVMRHVREGELAKAAQVLVSDGIATVDAACIKALNDLHPAPTDDSPPMPPTPKGVPRPGIPATAPPIGETVTKPTSGSAPGPSGWTYHMCKLAWGIPEFQKVLALLGSVITQDKFVPAHAWLNTSHLLPLNKPGGGIRPIATGEVFTRIIARWALRSLGSTDSLLLRQQYGVGTPGGIEPVVYGMTEALKVATNGFMSIDFRNAFNTVSRHAMAAGVSANAPQLSGIFRCLYNYPSHLLLRTPEKTHFFTSKTGGKQGDPIMPFLFSLAIKPLVAELTTRFARDLEVDDGMGNVIQKPLLWAYLDDINLALADGVTPDHVLEFLKSPDIVAKYGLTVNPAKCWFKTQQEMVCEGMEMLGTWIGGPLSGRSPADDLTAAAAERLRSRIATLDAIPLQHRLCILRLCYFPALNHLLRTLPPTIGIRGVEEFDTVTWDAISRWTGDPTLPPYAPIIARLPQRLGGLGLFSQAQLKPYAATSAFLMSRGFLRTRQLTLSSACDFPFRNHIQQCAVNLELPVDKLLDGRFWKEGHVQRRIMEPRYELEWMALFPRIPMESQLRLLENTLPLSRAWLQILPTANVTCLKDEETRYALRKILLSPFQETYTKSMTCFNTECNRPCTPSHHLVCKHTAPSRTIRHTAMVNALADRLRTVLGSGAVAVEEVVGTTNNVIRSADIVANVQDSRRNIDVAITTARTVPTTGWPGPNTVKAAVEADLQAQAQRVPLRTRTFFWDTETLTTSPTRPTKATLTVRKFRELALAASVGIDIGTESQRKRARYGTLGVTPFILTAGGGIGPEAMDLLDTVTELRSTDNDSRRTFRNHMLGHFSIILLRAASRIRSVHAQRCLAAI